MNRTVEQVHARNAAVKTLEKLGYTYHGGELWEPPIGEVPSYIKQPQVEVVYEEFTSTRISDIAKFYEDGNSLYAVDSFSGEKIIINVYGAISQQRHGDPLYQRVEREVDWHDIVGNFIKLSDHSNEGVDIYFHGSDKQISDENFIRMCHLVASMTEQPK